MSFMSLSLDERIACLQELLGCVGTIFRWVYDAQGTLLDTDCDEPILDALFSTADCMEYMLEYGQDHSAPLVLSIPYGLMWCAAFEPADDGPDRIHVFGPVSTPQTQFQEISNAVAHTQMPRSWVPKLKRCLEHIPSMMVNQLLQYTLMLHYCVTGEKLSIADIHFQRAADLPERSKKDVPKGDRMQTYMTEQALLQMVREGNLNYKKILAQAASISGGVGVLNIDDLSRAKLLLTTTHRSIQEISEQLCFGTRSFFDDTFKKIAGIAPAAYRAQNQEM